MANPVDPVLTYHTSQEWQHVAVSELPNNQPHQLPKQNHAEDHTEQTEATEQIFNLRILCEKYLQRPQDLYHVFMDFKKGLSLIHI